MKKHLIVIAAVSTLVSASAINATFGEAVKKASDNELIAIAMWFNAKKIAIESAPGGNAAGLSLGAKISLDLPLQFLKNYYKKAYEGIVADVLPGIKSSAGKEENVWLQKYYIHVKDEADKRKAKGKLKDVDFLASMEG